MDCRFGKILCKIMFNNRGSVAQWLKVNCIILFHDYYQCNLFEAVKFNLVIESDKAVDKVSPKI